VNFSAPEPLNERHDVSNFDCGNAPLNDWLKRQTASGEGLSARTYIVTGNGVIAAYYCLVAGSVARSVLPNAKLRRNMPDQVPVIVIGRLAVDLRFQRAGLGQGLLKDAITRTLAAAEFVGIRAMVVHAIDENAAAYYRKFGFVESPLDPLALVLPLETARLAL
jgi:GNAT superfamily N-acetyltransferase